MINTEKVGAMIAELRKVKNLTQNELGERLGVSFQAVSKWERGETLPDSAILLDLAHCLETTVDFILSGGETASTYNGRFTISDMIEGIRCIEKMRQLLGRDNLIYRYAVEGINKSMNTDIEMIFENERSFEAFVAEATLARLRGGAYVDVTDVKNSFKYEHLRNIVLEEAKKCGIN